MGRQKNIAVGLDIGKDSIKLVELAREKKGIKLTKIDAAKISPPVEGAQGGAENIAKVITELLGRNQIKDKKVILGINGQSVFVKFLEILPVKADKLNQTIKYEAQQQIPFPLEEVEWDAHLLGGRKQQAAQRVLLVAIKKDRLSDRMSQVRQAGLHPVILDVSTLSVYNCLKFNQDFDQEKLTAVLDIGVQSTDLLILKGKDFWMRSFAFGGDNIIGTLKQKLNSTTQEAEKLIEQMNIDSPDTQEAVTTLLEDLQGEIARSIEYYYFQRKPPSAGGQVESGAEVDQQPGASRIDEILLSGGTSRLRGLDKFLTEKFSCPVRTVEPFKGLHLDDQVKLKVDAQNKVLFSQAVGLALRGLGQSCIDINLLKEQIKAKGLVHQRMSFSVGSVVLSILILFGAYSLMRQDYLRKSAHLARLKNMLETFRTHQPRIKELERQEQALIQQTDLLRSLAANRALWLEALSELQRMLPGNLWLTDFNGTMSFDGSREGFASKLDLQGQAATYEDVNGFVAKLKSSVLFNQVKPLSSATVEETTDEQKLELVEFSISMNLAPMYTPRAPMDGE